MASQYILVRVDEEHLSDSWWDVLRERYPKLFSVLIWDDLVLLSDMAYQAISQLPGFSGKGPGHAPHPLIMMRNEDWQLQIKNGAKVRVFHRPE